MADMSEEAVLKARLRKLEALFLGAGTAGEKAAAEAGLTRIRLRLAELELSHPAVEMQFSMPDQWARRLFLALCRRYGLKPYRLHRQRLTTVMLRAPRPFVDQVLWPEFVELDAALSRYLDEVTSRLIREDVHGDTSEAHEIKPGLLSS